MEKIMHFLRTNVYVERVKHFLRPNAPFMVWMAFIFLIYILLFHRAWNVFAVLVVFHLISLIVAFSPVGEWFMRKMDGVREIETQMELDILDPLFAEVYHEANQKYDYLSCNIELYIKDEADINGYAYGTNTIVLTRGAVEMMDEDQIKGVLAHEFGHLANGDTRMLLALTVGNGFFSIFYMLAGLVNRIINHYLKDTSHIEFLSIHYCAYVLPLKFSRFVLTKTVLLIQLISALLIAVGRRNNEYRADEFACEIGYQEHLRSVLYLLHETNINQKLSFMEKMKSSHPHIAKRINRLEQM